MGRAAAVERAAVERERQWRGSNGRRMRRRGVAVARAAPEVERAAAAARVEGEGEGPTGEKINQPGSCLGRRRLLLRSWRASPSR
eukprot:scaffold74923_cov27-Phaeocystis_antarctica.AAC.1